MRNILCFAFMLISFSTFSQKKILDHSDFDLWNRVISPKISAEGNFIMYSVEKGEKDQHIKIKDTQSNLIFDYERSEDGQFTYDSEFAIFTIKAWKDSIVEMKRRKVKKDKMPKDTIGIFNLKDKSLHKIANINSYKLPEKWSGFIAYTYDNDTLKENKKSKDLTKNKKDKKLKKSSSKNGYPLVIRNLENNKEDTIPFVTNYTFAKEKMILSYITTGIKDSIKSGVYVKKLKSNNTKQVFESHNKTKYFKLNLSHSGDNLAFVIDADSTKTYHRPYELYTWNSSLNNAKLVLDKDSSPEGYRVSSCLLYTSPSPRDVEESRMPSSA